MKICKKKKFNKIDAMFALSMKGTDSRRKEMRIYFCKPCNAFHLTSEEYKC